MLFRGILLLGTAAISPLSPPQTPDTLDAIRAVRDEFNERYWASVVQRRGRMTETREEYGNRVGWRCSPDDGVEFCDGGDWVRGRCPADTHCHPPSDQLEELLLRSALEYPESGFLTGQAVFGLVRFGRPLDAMTVAQKCLVANGWCDALEGYVLWSADQLREAEEHFTTFLDSAPDSVVCQLADATWLLGSWSWLETRWSISGPEAREPWAERPCQERLAVSDTIWWLADPLYIVDGNDRKIEHLDRSLKAAWYGDLHDGTVAQAWTGDYFDARWANVVRRGPWDSYKVELDVPPTGAGAIWTSRKAARYHFMPDFEGEGFNNPSWRLLSEPNDEGYTPPYGAFHLLPAQIARFRETLPEPTVPSSEGAISMRLAVGGTIEGSPIAKAASSAYLILTDAPESFPLQLEARFSEGRTVFLASAPAKRHVISLEVLTGAGIGWHREMVEPLNTEGPGLSDLLLYRPVGRSEPDSLMAAAASMLGSTEPEDVGQLGIYWEVYGAEAEVPLEFQLRLEKEEGGLVDRLLRLFPGGEEEAPGTLSWSEPAKGPVSPKAIVLDVQELAPGQYTLVVGASWRGGEVVERRLALTVT